MSLLHVVAKTDFESINLQTLSANLPRLGSILSYLGLQLSTVSKWSLLWYLIPVALIAIAVRRRSQALCLAVALALPLSLDILPYIFTRLALMFHMANSFDRLILQLAPLAVLVLGLALDDSRAPRPETQGSAESASSK